MRIQRKDDHKQTKENVVPIKLSTGDEGWIETQEGHRMMRRFYPKDMWEKVEEWVTIEVHMNPEQEELYHVQTIYKDFFLGPVTREASWRKA